MNLIIFILGLAFSLLGNELMKEEGCLGGLGALMVVAGFAVAIFGLVM